MNEYDYEYEDEHEEIDLPPFSSEKIKAALDLLDEACDEYVLITNVQTDDLSRDITDISCKGSRMTVIGMIEYFRNRLINGFK